MLNAYIVLDMDSVRNHFSPTRFAALQESLPGANNTRIFLDWDVPEEHDAAARPYAILATPEGYSCKGKFSTKQFCIANLDFRVPMRHEKMYTTQSMVNLQNVSRVHIADSQFCLSENIGDTVLGKELVHSRYHMAGLVSKRQQRAAQRGGAGVPL